MARRTREIWRNLIGQLERSGKSREEFAKERGIPIGTLRQWIYRLDHILEIYRLEHEARARGIVRSDEHLALRRMRSCEAMDRFRAWLFDQQGQHPPKSPLGEAVRYALNQWNTLGAFLDDARIPVDNNASERALRVVALGRKNFLFVGDEDCGANLAGLYSLVATCDAVGVDPVEYLKDVLMRVDVHPASRIDELLPPEWVPPLRWSDTW